MRRFGFELIKIVCFVVLFVLIQQPIVDLRTEIFGGPDSVAHAQEERDRIERSREVLLGALEDSKAELQMVKMTLAQSSRQIKSENDELARLVVDKEEAIFETLDFELDRYRGTLEDALLHCENNKERLESIESQVQQITPNDSNWMVEAMLYPTIQIKGNKTVGSGVVIYSEPEARSGDGRIKDEGSRVDVQKYVTYAITAYHVVKEILGSDFPDAPLKDLRIMDPRDPLGMTVLSGTLEIYDSELDLALLKLGTDRRFEYVADLLPREEVERLELFTRIYAVGCPLGNNPLPTSGQISSKGKVVDGRIFWMVNAPTFFGNSGGGIFLSDTCKLMGVSSMIYTYTYETNQSLVVPHMGLFVPLSMVYDWLDGRGYKYVTLGIPAPLTSLSTLVTESAGSSRWKVGSEADNDD